MVVLLDDLVLKMSALGSSYVAAVITRNLLFHSKAANKLYY